MGVTPSGNSGERLHSLDAYRGLVMLAMASGGLALREAARHHPGSAIWEALAFHTDHVAWTGCAFWDLIQPSFIFIVGVAMPFSFANRAARGASWYDQFGHALIRSGILVLLGVFLASAWDKETNWVFTNVLSQIGLGYPFVFLLMGRPLRVKAMVAAGVLVAYWALFAAYPLPGTGFDFADHGAPADLEGLSGFLAHWAKNTNPAAAFDRWFLSLFPRAGGQPYRFNPGGYATLNFIPSAVTMLLGVMAGELLRSGASSRSRVSALLVAAVAGLAVGSVLDVTVCPSVKRIWTPSWTIQSAGWTCLLLAVFHAVIDVWGWKGWAFPLIVVGVNSIAFYMMAQLMKPWVASQLQIHFGRDIFQGDLGATWKAASVLLVFWLIALGMYRQRIFVRI